MNKRKHQIDKKVLRQDRDFCTRLPFAKKNREFWMNGIKTTYNSS